MNIFYLHPSPKKAPQYLYNKHCVKMILETAQMLCTAHHHYAELHDYDNSYIPYKKAHYNHPSTKWARENVAQYMWLYTYFQYLCAEYFSRYGRTHMSFTKCNDILSSPPKNIPNGNFTQPPQCMPDEFKAKCSVDAYWNYYINAKKHIALDWEGKWVYRPREIEQLDVYNNWKYQN